VDTVKVKATATGYFGIIRAAGDVFEVPLAVAERGASWFEPTSPLPKSKKAKIEDVKPSDIE